MNRRALLQSAALAPLFALAARVKAWGAFESETAPKRWLRARWDAGRDVATVEHADSPDGPWSPCTSSDWTPWRTDSACGFRYTPGT